MSWTPNEFDALILGARHQQIDEYEFMAKTAMANRYAQNAKRPREKSIFDAKRARHLLDTGERPHEEMERMVKLNDAVKGFTPNFIPKGGRSNDRTNASHRRGEDKRV